MLLNTLCYGEVNVRERAGTVCYFLSYILCCQFYNLSSVFIFLLKPSGVFILQSNVEGIFCMEI